MARPRLDLLVESIAMLIATIVIFLATPLLIPVAFLAPGALLPFTSWYHAWAVALAHDIEVYVAEHRDREDD